MPDPIAAAPSEVAIVIAYVGAFVGLVGGGVALFNSWKAVLWKRAELANNYMKDFNSNQELVRWAMPRLEWRAARVARKSSALYARQRTIHSA